MRPSTANGSSSLSMIKATRPSFSSFSSTIGPLPLLVLLALHVLGFPHRVAASAVTGGRESPGGERDSAFRVPPLPPRAPRPPPRGLRAPRPLPPAPRPPLLAPRPPPRGLPAPRAPRPLRVPRLPPRAGRRR